MAATGIPGRFVFVVLDGAGVGALPDAFEYGDEGSDTLGNLTAFVDVDIPNLAALGLGNIVRMRGVGPVDKPLAMVGRLAERSAGKDTTAGHWEHMGLPIEEPFPTYPEGFPAEVIDSFEQLIGRKTLGNVAASGTEIIARLGDRHLKTGRPIVYTSADSVFQIAAHVDVVPLEELYRYCRVARDILQGPHRVGRVIARPFAGRPGRFYRTAERKDFSLAPYRDTYLDLLSARGVPVIGVGKIPNIFANKGIARSIPATSNEENLSALADLLQGEETGLIFTNLVDFDMEWGHRNDPDGFARGLEEVDRRLPPIMEALGPGDRLLITADHGVDPTTVSTDHSREYVPVLYYPRPSSAPEATYEGWFSDTGATAFERLTGERPPAFGVSLEGLRPGRGWRRYVGRSGGGDPGSAATVLRGALGPAPECAVVLGSGLDRVTSLMCAEGETELSDLPYESLPGWPSPRVTGHAGLLTVSDVDGRRVAFLRGRPHRYEGTDAGAAQSIVHSLRRWGVRRLLLTNASGSLGPEPPLGTIGRVERILNLQNTAADGRVEVLDLESRWRMAAGDRRLAYAAVLGPQYETEAEVRALRALGADVVGMSTADEVRAARGAGIEVTVLSVVTNRAGRPTVPGQGEHEAVVRRSAAAAQEVGDMVRRWAAGGRKEPPERV